MVTEFVFVRHGETDANKDGVLQGSCDIPLNANGIRQANAAAEYLKETEFQVIYTSDLSRAEKTARIIAACGHENIPVIPASGLREWDCGRMSGMTWEQIKEHYPDLSMAFYVELGNVTMPGGESKEEFQKRVENFLRECAVRHAGGRVLLVAHGGVLQRIFRFVAGALSEGNLIPLAGNASVSTFICRNDINAWQLTAWNRNDHLKDLPQHQTRVL